MPQISLFELIYADSEEAFGLFFFVQFSTKTKQERKLSMKAKNQNTRSNYESIVGIIDQKTSKKLHLVVCATLATPSIKLGQGVSIIAPGSHVILTGESIDLSAYDEGDKLNVDGMFIKCRLKGQSVYVADGEVYVCKLSESEASQMIAGDMFVAMRSQLERMFSPMARDEHASVISQNSMHINRMRTQQYKNFLCQYTPSKIESELNTRIIGQEELTKATADFLYYHALRQIKPELPPRPMLIAGPSGSGKTEVWRVAKKLFEKVFKIEIVDGASMTEEGWKGDNKLSSHIDQAMSDGGILIIDEFDKLAKPRYEVNGSNVADGMQSEFLKLLEGEYSKEEDKKLILAMVRAGNCPMPGESKIDTKKMGIVLVGAFEDIKAKRQSRVGFGNQDTAILSSVQTITDEEYIDFGVLPELIGRIATKVTTNQLSDEEYVQIIYNPYSRVSTIINIFKEFGVDFSNLVDEDEMRRLIKRSKSNKTGVRWVSAQVENKLLASIRETGIDVSVVEDEPQNNGPQSIEEWMKQQPQSMKNNPSGNTREDEFFF